MENCAQILIKKVFLANESIIVFYYDILKNNFLKRVTISRLG